MKNVKKRSFELKKIRYLPYIFRNVNLKLTFSKDSTFIKTKIIHTPSLSVKITFTYKYNIIIIIFRMFTVTVVVRKQVAIN